MKYELPLHAPSTADERWYWFVGLPSFAPPEPRRGVPVGADGDMTWAVVLSPERIYYRLPGILNSTINNVSSWYVYTYSLPELHAPTSLVTMRVCVALESCLF